ncbi:MAG: hypothetical protein M3P89_15130 [Actinomycetota bacterium]|nr:hypothetical protein [Actinomycetota bacterium]
MTDPVEGGTVPRDARSGPTRDRAPRASGRRSRPAPRPATSSLAGGEMRSAGLPSARRPALPVPVEAVGARADGLVVGTVPPAARMSGALLVGSALVAVAALFPTYLVVAGEPLSSTAGAAGVPVALLVPVAHLLVGGWLVRGAVPKFGLAYAGTSGALALGQLLIELYRGRSSTARSAVEVLGGERVLTSSVEVAPGWVLGVAALCLVVLAGICAAAAWGRTVMDDSGPLDDVRSALAGATVLLGVASVLCLALPAADVPDQLVTDPSTGLQTVVTREGPQALLERPGLALLGGLLLAGAVLLCSVVVPSLRPRLASVGGLLALSVAVLAAALTGLRDAASSDDLEWTVPGAGLVLTGLGYAALTVLAWRLRRSRAQPPPSTRP